MNRQNPLPLVRQHLAQRQQRRRTVAMIRNTRHPGRGKVDMGLRLAERHTELGESEQ